MGYRQCFIRWSTSILPRIAVELPDQTRVQRHHGISNHHFGVFAGTCGDVIQRCFVREIKRCYFERALVSQKVRSIERRNLNNLRRSFCVWSAQACRSRQAANSLTMTESLEDKLQRWKRDALLQSLQTLCAFFELASQVRQQQCDDSSWYDDEEQWDDCSLCDVDLFETPEEWDDCNHGCWYDDELDWEECRLMKSAESRVQRQALLRQKMLIAKAAFKSVRYRAEFTRRSRNTSRVVLAVWRSANV